MVSSSSSSSLLLLLLKLITLLLLVIPFCSSASSSSQIENQEALSLLAFKNSLSLDRYNLLSSWNTTTSHCTSWYGVQCDPVSGKVTVLRIAPQSGIVGFLSPSLSNLTNLRILSLRNNRLSGPIPSQFQQLQALETLDLHGNNLFGPLIINFNSLIALDLSNNQLSGSISIGNSSLLVRLKLSNNYFSGNIPPEIAKCSRIRTLLLDGNAFQGRIPPELGLLSKLTVLDVSRNSLTDKIPEELAYCKKLSVLVLTNLAAKSASSLPYNQVTGGEFNAFEGDIPYKVLSIPNLQVVWAPRANLVGRLPTSWTDSCSLKVLNLGQNYFEGIFPERLSLCKNLTFLDLSSNNLQGHIPSKLRVPCIGYFNVSRNSFSGLIPQFPNSSSCDFGLLSYGKDTDLLNEEDIAIAKSDILSFWHFRGSVGSKLEKDLQWAAHDFSWNKLFGRLPIFSFENKFYFGNKTNMLYTLMLNNNMFNGSFPEVLFPDCNKLGFFSVNLSSNHISGALTPQFFSKCLQLTNFEAANNLISGSIPPEIGSPRAFNRIDLSNNMLSGSLPDEMGNLKGVKRIFLRANNLTGHISSQLGELNSLEILDLSQNSLTGPIPESLAKAPSLISLLLDHNNLSGEIPSSFSSLSYLVTLDLSFNNISGHIPRLQIANYCDYLKGNRYLNPCPDTYSPPPAALPIPMPVKRKHNRLQIVMMAMVTSVSVVFFVILMIGLVLVLGKRKISRVSTFRRKAMVTFADSPIELNYDDVIKATGNFSISNLIGTGGFGSTYKAELVPGYFVAVKRLVIGRFQGGRKQFDAEIRTLGTIRHKTLVTLVGYYVGESEMFLIYNYLSGGNLESFIHGGSGKNMGWAVIHKIAYDIAMALSFLHYSCVPRIIHRDIKPSNILLDEDQNAYLSDFGLARLLEVSKTHATTDVAGTFGYVAPEYATTCRVSDKADVYSFGVLLLELMSGKKSLDPSFCEYGNGFNIVTWAKLLIKEGRFQELFPSELWDSGPKDNMLVMLRLALTCTVESLSLRPTMKQVLEKLKQIDL